MKKILILLVVICFHNYTNAQLQIGPGTSWKSDASTYVVLDNLGIQYDATTAQLTNVFKFTGNVDANISGSSLPIFTKIELAKIGAAKLVLHRSINLTQQLNFQGGLFDLNGFALNMGANALFQNESESSRMMGANGYARIIANLNAPNTVNPGNLGAVITSSQNLGSTYIYRGVKSQTNGSGGGNSVLRYYDIIPANNSLLNATLRVNYFDAELNGLTENQLVMWKSDDAVTWISLGYTTKDASLNYVEKTAIDDFSRFTLSTSNNPLPVLFKEFAVECKNQNEAILTWKTASEENTDFFEIQRSKDGVHFTTIAKKTAAGNSNTEKIYSYTDIATLENNFYRIVQTDKNGLHTYTQVKHLKCGSDEDILSVYPNPTVDKIFLDIQSAQNATVHLKIIDALGKQVYTDKFNLQNGSNNKIIDVHKFASGLYLLIATWDNSNYTKTQKIIKQ